MDVLFFRIGIIALAVVCIISKDLIVYHPPVWVLPPLNINPALAYVSATLLIISSLGIIFQRKSSFYQA